MIGHNTIAGDQLRSIIERIERLEDERRELAGDIRDIYSEAKSNGYDVKALRTIVRLRKQDADQRREHEAILETYMHALGMLSDTPLGQAALARDFHDAAPGMVAGERNSADVSDPPFVVPDDSDLDIPECLRREKQESAA